MVLVLPYGDIAGLRGVFSVTGTTSGSPYTVAEEENSTLQPPFSCAAWSTFMKL